MFFFIYSNEMCPLCRGRFGRITQLFIMTEDITEPINQLVATHIQLGNAIEILQQHHQQTEQLHQQPQQPQEQPRQTRQAQHGGIQSHMQNANQNPREHDHVVQIPFPFESIRGQTQIHLEVQRNIVSIRFRQRRR